MLVVQLHVMKNSLALLPEVNTIIELIMGTRTLYNNYAASYVTETLQMMDQNLASYSHLT